MRRSPVKLTRLRRGVSAVIATLMLIAIGIASAVIVFAFVTGLIGNLTGSSQGIVVESGTLTVPTGVNTGTLVVTVKSTAGSPMTSIKVADDSHTLVVNNAAPGTTWTMLSGAEIPMGVSESAEAPIGPSGGALTAGDEFTFTVTVFFASGGTNVQTLSVKAQV